MSKLELRPSEELMSLVNNWADGYIKSVELPIKILEIGERDGLTKHEIRKVVEDALTTRGLSERRIRQVLPAELKDETKIHPRQSIAAVVDDYPTVEPDDKPIGKKIEEVVDVVEENRALRTQVQQLREVVAKRAVDTADTVETNFERLFEMLPNDDVDTFKNKTGTLMLMERVLVNFRYQDPAKRLKYQWWIRRIK